MRGGCGRPPRALDEDGVELTVVLLPIFEPLDRWTLSERRHRELALEILDELGLETFDLLEPLERAAGAGVTLGERTGDRWHPSARLARRFVRHLLRRGYLGSVVDSSRCGVGSTAKAKEGA